MEVQASLIQLGGKGVPKQKKPRVYRHPNASTFTASRNLETETYKACAGIDSYTAYIYIYNLYYPSRCGQSLSACKGVCSLTHVFTGQSNLVEAFGI